MHCLRISTTSFQMFPVILTPCMLRYYYQSFIAAEIAKIDLECFKLQFKFEVIANHMNANNKCWLKCFV